MARSSGVPPRLRNDGETTVITPLDETDEQIAESWVEISSQPSSSSLSSIGDEIVTTGLRVQHDPNLRGRRRVQNTPHALDPRHTGTSSQEEYEESESEEDPVMTSSNEHIIPTTSIPQPEYDAGSDSDDDDGNATALGRRTDARPAFTPQPNAFSHPPSTQRHGVGAAGSYFPPHAPSRHPYPPSRLASRQPSYNHQADHDAALRASLTTLLSIGAAAARGLPKRNQGGNAETSNTPMGLRFVPESELMGPEPAMANTSRPLSPSVRARSSPSVSSQEAVEKGKRKASAAKPAGEKARASKKKRMQASSSEEEGLISPTLLTWVISAGAVVLISVVGFGAGYVIGREVGRAEAMAGLNGSALLDTSSCGSQVVKSGSGGLRKFRWGIGGAARAVAA